MLDKNDIYLYGLHRFVSNGSIHLKTKAKLQITPSKFGHSLI